MSEEKTSGMSREERLAAKLRENLRRRKAQTREMRDEAPNETGDSGARDLPNRQADS